MSALNNSPLLGASGSQGYFLQRSVRLRSSASAYFNRTPASAGNRKTWTWSGWVKRGALARKNLFSAYVGSGTVDTSFFSVEFNPSDKIGITGYSTVYRLTTAVYRDPSAWYHIAVAIDTTQATAANRFRLYVNGVEVTAFDTSNNPAQNTDLGINQASPHYIGWDAFTTYYDGYTTEINFIDGQQLTASSFGEYNSTTGVWQPKKYVGTYGTNGFYLNFQDNSGATATTIGKDSSGNGNNWTPNNISVTAGVTYDSMTDVPTLTSPTTANYCVGNPLNSDGSTWTNANLNFSLPNSTNNAQGTMAATSGKFYWEVVYTSGAQGTGVQEIGLRTRYTNGIIYAPDGSKYINGTSSAYGATYTTSDVIGVALDMTGGTVTFYKNNVSQGAISISGSGMVNATFSLSAGGGVTSVGYVNFGQRPFTYTPPTGFKALNTYNLPTPTIANGANQFAASTYTGNGSTQTITNGGNNSIGKTFQPDLAWIKVRSITGQHVLTDSIRGVDKQLFSSLTNAEQTSSGGITSFNSNGFGLGSGVSPVGSTNENSQTYIAWQWKASNAAPVTNTSGSISSQVSANPSAGFSIVTYTGTGANATVGHGLGVAPNFIIIKSRSAVANWMVGGSNIASAGGGTWASIMEGLNTTNAINTGGTAVFNSTAPTSSVFSLGTEPNSNGSGRTFVAYCWSAIAGYSAFGKYTGNGSADGVFVYTGFRPRLVMIKGSSFVSNWFVIDTSRSSYNVSLDALRPNLDGAEVNSPTTTYSIDILSNGFKLRTSAADSNTNGATFIYAAFAENPFNYSLAR
jgi:hypothetical protein